MFTNPITTIIGIIVALCPIVGAWFPEIKAVCDTMMGEAIGLGFIASRDSMKLPFVQPGTAAKAMALIGTATIFGATLYGCSSLFSGKNQIETILAAQTAGVYTVVISKDGSTLYTETWECTTDGQKLTGCHKR